MAGRQSTLLVKHLMCAINMPRANIQHHSSSAEIASRQVAEKGAISMSSQQLAGSFHGSLAAVPYHICCTTQKLLVNRLAGRKCVITYCHKGVRHRSRGASRCSPRSQGGEALDGGAALNGVDALQVLGGCACTPRF